MIAKNPSSAAFYCRYMPGRHPDYARYIIPATSQPLPDELRRPFLRRCQEVLATGNPAEFRLKASNKPWDVQIVYHRKGTVGTYWRPAAAS